MYGTDKYGMILYSQETQDGNNIDGYKPNLMRYLPNYYQDNVTMVKLQDSMAEEFGPLNFSKEDILNQFFLDTATWGLSFRENELGIETDPTKPYEWRREIIRAKLRGASTTTKKMIKKIAETFSGTEVEVIEHPSEYMFEIKFVGIKGIPPNMAGLIQAINEIKPAHLEHVFTYSYSWWGTLKKITWGQAKTKTWNELKTYD